LNAARIGSDQLVYDLQFRLRCQHCNRRFGFRIAVVDDRGRGDRRVQPEERVIVPGEVRPNPTSLPLPTAPNGLNNYPRIRGRSSLQLNKSPLPHGSPADDGRFDRFV